MKLFPALYSNPSVIHSNIDEIWQQRTYQDYNTGKNWYKEANKFSLQLAEQFNITPVVSAGVTACLSPQKEWGNNKEIVQHFFERVKKAPVSGWKDAKHWLVQKRKAWRIYRMRNPSIQEVANELHGLKTVNFFNSIQNPLTCDHFTLDRHMIMIALGQVKQKLTVKQYKFIKEQYLKFAQDLKMIPSEFQGVLWITLKRVKKI